MKEDENKLQIAETRRLEAERLKLELEAREIERRLNARWWEGQKFTQYLLAIIITAALLFGWTRVYLEPILRKEAEVNKLAQERNAAINDLLEARNNRIIEEREEIANQRDTLKGESDKLKVERGLLVDERDQLKGESNRLREQKSNLEVQRDRLKADRDDLESRRRVLQSVVAGFNLALYELAQDDKKFFSIYNAEDPINELSRSHGWETWIDNWFGALGYYLVIQRPDVRSNEYIIVCRSIEIEDMKRKLPKEWRKELERFIEKSRGGPVLALDYSYLALQNNQEAPIGGMLYRKGGKDVEFYAPLREWSERLRVLFPNH